MAKRKKVKKSSFNNYSKYYKILNFFIAFIIIVSISFAIYNYIEDNKPKQNKINKKNKPHKKEDNTPKFEELTKALKVEYIDDETLNEQELLKSFKEDTATPLLKKDIQEIEVSKKKIIKKTKPIEKEKVKPLLVIIIDDVSTKKEFDALRNTNINLTLSFFPPDLPYRKNTPYLSSKLKSYMIHLPCEAKNKAFDEIKTLHTNDNFDIYDKRIKEIRTLFPKALFINNHTGSVLTADNSSMDKLMKALKKYNFSFVDSKTTNKSVAKIYANKYNIRFFSRNIFIDNTQNINKIVNQIRKGIKLAQKKGFAIIIGHPHKATIKALIKSKKYLKKVKVVTIDELSNYIHK